MEDIKSILKSIQDQVTDITTWVKTISKAQDKSDYLLTAKLEKIELSIAGLSNRIDKLESNVIDKSASAIDKSQEKIVNSIVNETNKIIGKIRIF